MKQPPIITQIFHPSGKLFEAYRQFVSSHPHASFFQSDAFFHLARQWPDVEAVLLVAFREEKLYDPGKQRKTAAFAFNEFTDQKERSPTDQSMVAGSLLAIIIKEPITHNRWLKGLTHMFSALSSRTIIYGGPLLGEGTRLERELCLKTLIGALQEKVVKRSLFTQYRNFFDLTDYLPAFRSLGFTWHDRLNLLVDTSSREQVWSGLSSSRRRQIKKSIKNGARIIYEPDNHQLDAFYCLLHELYRQKVRKPLPSRAFFHQLNKNSHARIFLIEYEGKIIGGIACPLMPGRAMYEWYVVGLDQKHKQHKVYPSVLVTWAAMEYAANHNLPCFDFMGMGKADAPYGVRDFKARFGGQWVSYGRFSKINRRIPYLLAELGYNLHILLKRVLL